MVPVACAGKQIVLQNLNFHKCAKEKIKWNKRQFWKYKISA